MKNGFVNALLSEEIFVRQPEGFVQKEEQYRVYFLRKADYSQRQSSWKLKRHLHKFMIGFECKPSVAEPTVCLCNKKGWSSVFIIYVDDVLMFFEDDSATAEIIGNFGREFAIRVDERIEKLLGFSVGDTGKCAKLHKAPMILRIIIIFKLEDCKAANTPRQPDLDSSANTLELIGHNDPKRQLVGTLLHLPNKIPPDIAYAAGCFSQFVQSPNDNFWRAGKHVLKCLKEQSC